MAGDNRGSSSLFRRHEQLRRWQESETNKQELTAKSKKSKVKFSDGCIFLAAGAAGDKDELKRLLDRGADINTVNQDGITALHAACIDNNLEIVEFLVDNGADINQCDMEGWTPLHATSSCGYLTMAKFLIDRGADLSVVNNDGELAFDVVDQDDVAHLLQEEMEVRGIDSDASRSREERRMLEDAQYWYNLGYIDDPVHPKTGATALHVAAAKGYIKVLRLLIQTGADVNAKDLDGWTSLHAAAHWGQNEAVEILCDSMADMEIVNHVGQTPYDLADEMIKCLMDELRRKQDSIKLKNKAKLSKKRKTSPQIERSKKKEKESQRSDSEGTSSSDESSSDVDKRTITNRVDSNVGHSEIQSWRRPSLLNKTLAEEKVSDKEQTKVIENSTPHINSNEDTLVKDDRNCQDVLRVSESMPNVSSTSPTRPTSRSFVPPSRDDESETQRKAHAKMIRSTRRSTQGITLEDVKSAEQLMKNKTPSEQHSSPSESKPDKVNSLVKNGATSPAENSFSLEDTRHKVGSTKDAKSEDSSLTSTQKGTQEKEDVSEKSATASSPATTASSSTITYSYNSSTSPTTTASTTATMTTASATTTTSSKETTSSAIQKKKKPKRRSTGVVHVDMDEIDPDRKAAKDSQKHDSDEEETEAPPAASVSEKESKQSSNSRSVSRSSSVGPDNGQIDYKKLYEEQVVENDRLMNRLRAYEKELRHTREAMDNNNKMSSARNAMAESERREKRSLERKLSEMEEELKQLQKLKADNEKLRAENRALTRVISKLTNSATAGMGALAALSK